MANERYKIIKLMEHKEWLKDAPIKVDKSQILFDTQKNTTLLQIKMFNLSSKSIKSVFLDVVCYDNENKNVESLTDVAYLMIEAEPQTVFGDKKPILLESLQIESVEITIGKVIFADGSVWNNYDREKGIILGEQKVINHNDSLYEQINREFIGINSKPYYWFENSEDYWRCTCGQTNSHTASKCGYCGIEKSWIEKHLNKEYLLEEDKKYQEALVLQKIQEDDFKQKQAEEALILKRQEEALIAEKNKNKKRLIKRALIVMGIFLVAIGASKGYENIISPMITYNKAMGLYNNKDFDKAVEAFSSMQGYKNSEDMITKSIYQNGIKLLDSGEYESSLEQFKQVETYEDAKKYIIECHYNIGNELINNSKWNEAIDHLTISKDYEDSYNKIQECYFQIANGYLFDKKWEEALTTYKKIDSKAITEDLNASISEAYYQYGLFYATDQLWDKALDCMNQAIRNGEYKDARSLIDVYNNNIKENELLKQYNEAIKFEEEGRLDLAYDIYKTLSANYKDCGERMNRISGYINLCGQYEGEIDYNAKTMKDSGYRAFLTKAVVTITFDNNIPIINISTGPVGKSPEDFKDKLQNMPITKVVEGSYGWHSSKTVMRFTNGILYKDYYADINSSVSSILKFKKL
ncbi:hypothetical protein LXJ15735_09880 [Lacrimispora xylanolytica]